MKFDYTYCEPFSPSEVTQIFTDFSASWCIAGGWGLDLFMGKVTRDHGDIDVVVLRDDQGQLFNIFRGSQIFVVDPPGALRAWEPEEYLAAPLYNIWVRKERTGPWKIQIMLQDHTKQEWLFRRDHSITGALEDLMIKSKQGIPILNPTIQLLYKAKNPRGKDQDDFREVLPYLQMEQRMWLHEKIGQVYGPRHRWMEELIR